MTKREAIHKELKALYKEGAELAVAFQKKEGQQFQYDCVASPESGQKVFTEMRDFARLKEAEKRSKDDGQGKGAALHSGAEVRDFA
jgi:hypothetical protein